MIMLCCFTFPRLQQHFSYKALLHFWEAVLFFLAESIFISFNKGTLKAEHVVSTFSVLGRSSIHRSVFRQPVPSPSYFPTSHDLPCAAETRGKVAALRRLDTGKTGDVVLTNPCMPASISHCGHNKAMQSDTLVLDIVYSAFARLLYVKADAKTLSNDN